MTAVESQPACRDGIATEPDPSRWCWRVAGHEAPHRDPFGREWTASADHDETCCMNGVAPSAGPHPDCPGKPGGES